MATVKDRASGPAGSGLNDDIGEDKRLELYRTQVVIREAEQRAFDLFLQNLVKGTSHLSLGQEAVAAGFAGAMKKGDLSFCTYRGHAHTLARGVSVEKVLGELMQRDNGLMRGKGGSMHLTSVEHGVMGSYAIIGAHLPIACGAAWRAQYKGAKDVSVCFFGDGTTNIGAFHEALNFAAVWKLPVIFVCENNLYMEYTPIADVTAVEHPAADRASAYGLERIVIDGNDADAVYRTAQTAYRQGARRQRPVADRMHDLSPQRPFARRSGEIPARGRAGALEAARPDQDLSRAAAAIRRGRESDRARSTPRCARSSTTPPRPARPRPTRRSISSPPTSTPMEAGHGGTDLSRRRHPRHRAGDGRDPDVVFLGEDVAKAGGVFKATVGLSSSSGRCACATRRSPSRRSWARPWARR